MLKLLAAGGAAVGGWGYASKIARSAVIADGPGGFIDVARVPNAVTVITEEGRLSATGDGRGAWDATGAKGTTRVVTRVDGAASRVTLSAAQDARPKWIELRWSGQTSAWQRVLGDQWERAYGDLRWRSPQAGRVSPWYLVMETPQGTHAVGVKTQPNAFCSWLFDTDGVVLLCDVRSGGVGVELGDRELHVCDVISRRGSQDESAFAALCAFCKQMCPKPRLTDQPVYGFNDWYYAYGHNTPAGLLADADALSELASSKTNRPYCVIDDGWQTKEKAKEGQWSATRPTFGFMSELAAEMKKRNVRPGIWMRPLVDETKSWPQPWHMSRDRNLLDPTILEVKQVVANDITRLREWGFQLIKHDFSSVDIAGRWGREMQDGCVTQDGWSFHSRKQTTAEIINDLYATIRKAAGDDVVVLGCNTMSHLTAGVFEVNRIGDDTSGNEWHRNPQMGVNCLAFRGPQQGAFYGADADCAPITTRIEWKRTKQWLDLVARSGTPLFISLERKAATTEVKDAIRKALSAAALNQPLGEPLDWTETATPRRWKLDGEIVTYDWS